MIPGSTNQLLAAGVGYQISRSVRLRSSATAFFNRTPSSASNRTTFTWSGWVKRGALSSSTFLPLMIANDVSGEWSVIGFGNNSFYFANTVGSTNRGEKQTTAVYRDTSAWYHLIVAVNTNDATASDRIKLYVNGGRITAFIASTDPTSGQNTYFNAASVHRIGYFATNGTYHDGYLTEINFIDGQALTPSSFGETNPVTGVWQPKKYTGTYGTNGFYLNFSDNSNNTAATIGKDSSGNGNNWTPNNISVTAGATYDSMLDVPTPWGDGGNGRGNYATLNPLRPAGTVTYANANLELSSTQQSTNQTVGTMAVSSGKWYFEATLTAYSTTDPLVGISNVDSLSGYPGQAASSYSVYTFASNTFIQKVNNNTFTNTGTAKAAQGDVIGVAFDLDSGKIWFSKNNTWIDSGDPANGTNPIFSSLSGTFVPAFRGGGTASGSCTWAANFGQRPFAYTPPSGFRALNTQNLPVPTILKGNQYFDVSLYTGTGANQTITNSGAMQPDLVWLKSRSSATWVNVLTDSMRGVNAQLFSNLTNAEEARTDRLQSFNSNGFTVGSYQDVNQSTATYVGWQWKEGATQGFDIVTYTGNGITGRTVAHNLGVAPAMMIVRDRNNVNDWVVYHRSIGNTTCLVLNSTSATVTPSSLYWNNTTPTSSVFTVGTASNVNASSRAYVAYLFAEVAGFSRFGSYTGNGSADGPFVFCGFRPRYILIKISSAATDGWTIQDTARAPNNVVTDILAANSSASEATLGSSFNVDILSNGFKIRNTTSAQNTNGATYIFAAFAENPTKYALAR